jgi:hypothetical protein
MLPLLSQQYAVQVVSWIFTTCGKQGHYTLA